MEAILCVDIGSSGIHCCAYILDNGVRPIDSSVSVDKNPILSSAEPNPDPLIILERIDHTVASCIGNIKKLGIHRVNAVGFCCLSMNLIGINSCSEPVSPLLSYRGSIVNGDIDRFSFDDETISKIHRKTGCNFHCSYAPMQLISFMNQKKKSLDNLESWQTISGILISRWTGIKKVPMSFCEASWTGMLNLEKLEWDKTVLRILEERGFPTKSLPALADYDEFEGTITTGSEYGVRWPELIGCKIFLGMGDGACATIGSGTVDLCPIALTIGTSAAARVVVRNINDFDVSKGLWCYRIDRKRLLLGGALSDGGSLFEWACSLAGIRNQDDMKQFIEEASTLPPAEHGLTFLPFLSGERAPGWEEGATGTITGIKRKTTGPEILRAAMEAVSYRLAEIIELMDRYISPDIPIVGSGFAVKESSMWRQILCDVLNRPLLVPMKENLTLHGLAMLVSEYFPVCTTNPSDEVESTMIHVPNLIHHEKHVTARRRQQDLYKKMYKRYATRSLSD